MIVLEFDSQTRVLNAPPGWNASEPIKCGMLPIRDTKIEGMPAMQSYWKPEPHELASLAAGAHIRLTVYGGGHPPVSVEIERCDAVIERAPPGAAEPKNVTIGRTLVALNLPNADAFFGVTVHINARGEPVPTISHVTDNERFTKELGAEMHQHLRAIAETLRKAYAPK